MPPLLVPICATSSGRSSRRVRTPRSTRCCAAIARRLSDDRRRLVEQFRLVDVAHKVVGVGSVGYSGLGRPAARPRLGRSAAPAGQGGPGLGAGGLRRSQPLRPLRPSRRGGPAAHAGDERHLPGLAPRARPRRGPSRLLRPPAAGRQGRVRPDGDASAGSGDVRPGLRVGARPGARAVRATRSRSRPTSGPVPPSTTPSLDFADRLRGPERARPRRARRGCAVRP